VFNKQVVQEAVRAARAEVFRLRADIDRNLMDGDSKLEIASRAEAIERTILKLERAEDEKALVRVYDDSVSLIARVAEFPRTLGETAAGIYLRALIGEALEKMGIDPTPPPMPSAQAKSATRKP
jgi:hypothetical protein